MGTKKEMENYVQKRQKEMRVAPRKRDIKINSMEDAGLAPLDFR